MTAHVHPGRNTGRGKAGFRGVARGRATIAPPALTAGKVRCPVCRNAIKTDAYGFLRRHRDLFGHDCHNRATT